MWDSSRMLSENRQHMPSSVVSGLCMKSTSHKGNQSRQHNMLYKEDCVLASQLAVFHLALHTMVC